MGGLEEADKAISILWEDQVEFAKTLVERRRVLSTVLAVIVGLGIFRIDLFRSSGDKLVVCEESLLAIRASLTLSCLFFGLGGYLLFSQNSTGRRFVVWGFRSVKAYFSMIYRKSRAPSREEQDKQKMELVEFPSTKISRASVAMWASPETSEEWASLDERSAKIVRLERLRAASLELGRRNERVAGRLRESLICLCLGFFFVFVALLSYLWSIGAV